MKRLFVGVFVTAFAFVVASDRVEARGKLRTTYKYYSVSGSTAASIHRNMTVPTGFFSSERSYANITMKPRFKGVFQQKKRCHLKGFGIDGNFVIRLPKLKKGTRLSPRLNHQFRNFTAYVRKHELVHRRIWTRCLRSAESRINRLRFKNCDSLDVKAAAIIKDEWAKCEARNNRFDALEQKRLLRLPLVKAAFKPSRRVATNSRKTKSRTGNKRRRALGRARNFN